MMKHTISILSLIIALMLCLGGCGQAPVETEADGGVIDGENFEGIAATEVSAWKVGDKVTIGGYSFTAVAIEKDSTLLVCDTSVKTDAFHKNYEYTSWAECSLRAWLNGEFADTLKADASFNSELLITDTLVTAENYTSGLGECTTEDTVFLLSIDDVRDYKVGGIGENCWLRSTGEEMTHAAIQRADGSLHMTGYRADYPIAGVRPCIRLHAKNNIAAEGVALSAAQVGAKVIFGNYGGEDILWDVLAVKDGKALMMTDKVIDAAQFHTANTATYATSALAAWLNGEFKDAAFDADELAKIDTAATVATPVNPKYGTAGGADSTGIFVLSEQEFRMYCTTDSTKRAEATDFAVANGASVDPNFGTSGYWLRTIGETADKACYVYYYGDVCEYGIIQMSDYIGVRPAMWVTIG